MITMSNYVTQDQLKETLKETNAELTKILLIRCLKS